MTEPKISCPQCKSEIRLTESLAAPLIAATISKYELASNEKDAAILKREGALREQERELAQAKRTLHEHVAEQVERQLSTERARVSAEEHKKARLASAAELESKSHELAELKHLLEVRDHKLAEAQQAQANLIKMQRALDDERRELQLTVEKRVDEGLAEVRARARREAEDSLKQRVLEKDQTIQSMQRTIEQLKHKAEQGSQQIQGEVQELALESLLKVKFPFDVIDAVPKGEHGGDILQRVRNTNGQLCGAILWETKQTRTWSDTWLAKLREDQRSAKAEVCVLVSHTLPKGVETFNLIDGVWVLQARCVLPVATLLRDTLLQVNGARLTAEGQQSKTEMVYQYLTGPRFRQRVEAIVEAFSSMQDDLDRERQVILKQWSKRQAQIERVMSGTIGMYGDLQGIAGKSLQQIAGLELEALEFKNVG